MHQTFAKPTPGRLLKPSRLERLQKKRDRQRARTAKKRAVRMFEMEMERARRAQTFSRDGGRCRAFGVPLMLVTDDPFKLAHCHHYVYRSACGSDEVENRITLSPKAHQMEHDALLKIEGEPNGLLFFTELDLKGQIVRTWESPLP